MLKHIVFLVKRVLFFLGLHKHFYNVELQAGELVVTGKNSIVFNLEKRPISVHVYFSDNCVLIPCNYSIDWLSFSIKKDNLKIKWNVSGVRTIKWLIHY